MDIVVDEILKKLITLPYPLQRQVLLFVDALQVSSLRGTPGQQLLKFVGTFSAEDLAIMKQAIDEGYEQINSKEGA